MNVLLVEDNPGDVRLILEAAKAARVRADFAVVGDGDSALRYLRQEGEFAESPATELLILDLNLPVKSGFEVLAEMKQDPALHKTIVAILTSSKHDAYVCATYDSQICAYFTKPDDFADYIKTLHDIFCFCLALQPARK